MCDSCGWEDLLIQIEDMLDDEDESYTFATDTLEGIQSWVSENEHCTAGQKSAVNNIQRCKH
jgi:hypothetical protein